MSDDISPDGISPDDLLGLLGLDELPPAPADLGDATSAALPDDLDELTDDDALWTSAPAFIRKVIDEDTGHDRSAQTWRTVSLLLECGYTDTDAAKMMTRHRPSRDKGRFSHLVGLAIGKARLDHPHGGKWCNAAGCTNKPQWQTEPLTELKREPARPVVPMALADCLAVYRKWMHLADDDQVIAALGAISANLLGGDPLWLLFVGAPGSGKTETISPFHGLDYVHSAATVTEAALLSGTPKKEIANGARGGLLRELGDFGIVLVKDFSGVLSMNRDARAAVLSALREVYDGSWTRRVGADGGRALHWTGKAGLIGAVTPSIDRHHAVMGALGERFVLYRLTVVDDKAQARRRLGNRGREVTMRSELADAVAGVLATVDRATPLRALGDDEIDRLVDLAAFVVRARTAVERDGYTREVLVMPTAEAPGRLVGALGALLAGCEVVGADQSTAWRIVTKVGWDCIPDVRRRVLDDLYHHDRSRTADLSTRTGIPRKTIDVVLEDMAMLGLIDRTKQAEHDTAAWVHSLTAHTREDWPGASYETSVGENSP